MTKVPLFCVFLFLFSCQGTGSQQDLSGQQKAEQDSLWKSLMAMHDEVMPEMSTINRLSGQIEEAMQREGLTPEDRAALQASLTNLQEAGDDMWSWMASLKVLPNLRKDSLSHQQIMASLKKDNQSIQKVSRAMKNSIARAEDLLAELENQPGETQSNQ